MRKILGIGFALFIASEAIGVEAPDPLSVVEILNAGLQVEIAPESFAKLERPPHPTPFDSLGGFYSRRDALLEATAGSCTFRQEIGVEISRVGFQGEERVLVRSGLFRFIPEGSTFVFERADIHLAGFDSFNGYLYVLVNTLAARNNPNCTQVPGEFDSRTVVMRISGLPTAREGFPPPFPER